MDGKKVSGILTEASVALEDGFLDYVILGIGINVYPPENGFPEELKNIAGAVFSEAMGDGKNRLAAAFLNCFMALCQSLEDNSYIQEYRKRSFLIGREILVLLPEGTKKASALDVDGECRLIVRYEDGAVAALDSGEVRVHRKGNIFIHRRNDDRMEKLRLRSRKIFLCCGAAIYLHYINYAMPDVSHPHGRPLSSSPRHL